MHASRKILVFVIAPFSLLTLAACLPTPPSSRSSDSGVEPTSAAEVECAPAGVQPGAENEPDEEESALQALLCASWSATVVDSGYSSTGWYFSAEFQDDGTVLFEQAPSGDFIGSDATGEWELTANQLVVDIEGAQSLVTEGETIDIGLTGEFDGSSLSLVGEGSDGLTYSLTAVGLPSFP